MQPDQATITLLTRMYRGFNARDTNAVLAEMQPDVEWPQAFLGGYVQGQAAVRAYWAKQWSEIDPHVDPTGFEQLPDGRTDVTVHQVGARPRRQVAAGHRSAPHLPPARWPDCAHGHSNYLIPWTQRKPNCW